MSRARRTVVAALVLVATTVQSEEPTKTEWALEAQGVRPVAIPEKDFCYRNGTTRVLRSTEDLSRLLEDLTNPDRDWGDVRLRPHLERASQRFTAAFAAGEIDFDKEAVLVVFQTFGSGSIRCWLKEPRIKGDTLFVKLERSHPLAASLDMAHLAFALRLPLDLAKVVEVKRFGRNSTVRLPLDAAEAAVE